MRLSYGYGGWVRVDEPSLPGPLYVRLRPAERGRWYISEIYLDGRDQRITAAMLRGLPLAALETLLQADGGDQDLARGDEHPSVQMSVLASHYGTVFGPKYTVSGHPLADDWVAAMWRSQIAGSEDKPVERRPDPAPEPQLAEPPPLRAPEGRLTDGFLRDVASAYAAAIRRGEQPAKALAEQARVPVRTVHRWIYTARRRGVMPPGTRGRVG